MDADDACLLQLFETEINRKVKREPALAVESRTKMFPDPQDQEELTEKRSEIDSTDIVGELWTFG
jgi:U3 small nucleolar RNA-associated protein 19